MDKPGYHLKHIKKGVLGELSKVFEEVKELKDAKKQKAKVMILVELSDILGAIESYLDKHHPGMSMAGPAGRTSSACVSKSKIEWWSRKRI